MLSVFLLGVSLAMDAFAAAVCCGLQAQRLRLRDALVIGAWFGTAQTVMPLIGGLFGSALSVHLWRTGCVLAFALLVFLGLRMVYSALTPQGASASSRYDLRPLTLAALAVATSLDALAAGVSLAFLGTDLLPSALLIGAVAFALSVAGGLLGRGAGGSLLGLWAELAGGCVLIWLGLKILITG